MQATEQYFPVVLFIVLFRVVLTCEPVCIQSSSVTIQMKATEQYFPVLLQSGSNLGVCVDKILKYNHSNERYWAVLSVVLFTLLTK